MKQVLIWTIGSGFLSLMVAGNIYLFFTPVEISPILKPTQAEQLPAIADEISIAKDDKALLLVHSQTRPLFAPSRRPWVAPVLQLAPEPVPSAIPAVAIEPVIAINVQPPNVTLIGIQKTPDGAKALLLKAGTAEAEWFISGQQIDSWTVSAIENETVELANGTQTMKLELYPSSTLPAAPAQPVQP
jgi:hypothetical protein